MKLHEAIVKLLTENGRPMNCSEIAEELNKNKWYQKKDRSIITRYQIHGRTKGYIDMFDKSGSLISLRVKNNFSRRETKEIRKRGKKNELQVTQKNEKSAKSRGASENAKNFRERIMVSDKHYDTLTDILPTNGQLKILFVAKCPATKSVNAGHYFQGRHGRSFWNILAEYKILNVPIGDFEDNHLLRNGYGITDIVKVARDYGDEPSHDEYLQGGQRVLSLVEKYAPKVVIFVYKKVLDNLLQAYFDINTKSHYGFNPSVEGIFGTRVFVFPMPGTPCTKEKGHASMRELQQVLSIVK